MRILHTADWHLGHTLHDQPRAFEHDRFLEWLLATLEAESVDALLVAGDVFDTSNPSAQAQAQWYRFLATARRRLPALQVVVVGGNHDSAGRLDAPTPLLNALGVTVVGGAGDADPQRLVVPLKKDGEIRAWVCAVPFLRPADLPGMGRPEAQDAEDLDAAERGGAAPARLPVGGDPLVEGVRRFYAGVLDAARARREAGQALLAMGHLYLTGTRLSELSERRILGGNQHALPVELFPDDVAYVALGHLHLAQEVGGRRSVRYSGSPLPLSLAEADYPHQVVLLDLRGEALGEVRALRVPRTVPIVRVPAQGAGSVEEVVAALKALEVEPPEGEAPCTRLEVRVRLDGPDPSLRRRIEEAIEGRPLRLLKITREQTGDGRALGEAAPQRQLDELDPEDVFRRRWERDYDGEPPPELLAAFHELAAEAVRTLEEDAA